MRPHAFRLTAAAGATAAVLAVPSSSLGADAVYGGTTTGGDPIVVKADANAATLRSLVVSFDASCADGNRFPGGGELMPVKPVPGFAPGAAELLVSRNAKGRFSGTKVGVVDLRAAVAGMQLQIAGKLAPKRASGTLSAIVKISDKATGAEITSCQTGSQRWVATRAPGVIYGGVTSQGEPLVVRLNRERTRVNDVLTTWRAPCAQGFFRVADHWGNFGVKRTGRFGNRFDQEFPMEAGGRRRYAYAVSGRVGRTSAKGTLQVKVSETDGSGAATENCDTGGVTWKAATG